MWTLLRQLLSTFCWLCLVDWDVESERIYSIKFSGFSSVLFGFYYYNNFLFWCYGESMNWVLTIRSGKINLPKDLFQSAVFGMIQFEPIMLDALVGSAIIDYNRCYWFRTKLLFSSDKSGHLDVVQLVVQSVAKSKRREGKRHSKWIWMEAEQGKGDVEEEQPEE